MTQDSPDARPIASGDRARPAREVLPKAFFDEIAKRKRGQRGPQKKPTKVAVTIRLDRHGSPSKHCFDGSPDVVRKFKSRGPGWQTRINAALRKASGR